MLTQSLQIDRTKLIYTVTILLSLILHVVFLVMLNSDMFLINLNPSEEKKVQEVTVIFPENKPKMIVENKNENDQRPENADLLSERNSKASNPFITNETGELPHSAGNTELKNLSSTERSNEFAANFPVKKFSRDALSLDKNALDQDNLISDQDESIFKRENRAQQMEETSNTILQQQKFSADQLGGLTLSTYAWEWAPYINAMKRKLHQVWYAPVAYSQLGLISGQTTIQYVISRSGELVKYNVLEHHGHESLRESSINAIVSLFPFKPLPQNFPDQTLTIRATLIYPDLRERIR